MKALDSYLDYSLNTNLVIYFIRLSHKTTKKNIKHLQISRTQSKFKETHCRSHNNQDLCSILFHSTLLEHKGHLINWIVKWNKLF